MGKIKIAEEQVPDEEMATWENDVSTRTVQTNDDEEMDEVFSDMPGNEACIQLYRIKQQGGRPTYLCEIRPSEWSLAYVKERFGGGRYSAKGKYRDGRKKRTIFDIEGEPLPDAKTGPEKPEPIAVQPIAPLFPANAQPQYAGNAFESTILTLMKQLIQQTQQSETQMLEKMRLYKELFAAPERKEAPLEQALSMLKQGIELGAAQGGGDGGNIWLLALDKLKDPLTKIVDTVNLAITSQGLQRNPGTLPTPAPGAPVPSTPNQGDPMLTVLRAVLPSLINGAAKNTDPNQYVNWLLDQLPEGAYAGFKNWLNEPDCLDRLAMIEPGVRYQRNWWIELRAALIEAMNEESQDGFDSVQPQHNPEPSTGGSTNRS